MLLRPTADDVRVIVNGTGLALLALGLLTTLVAVVSLAFGDVDSAAILLIGGMLGVSLGTLAQTASRRRRPVSWTHGVVAATLSWVSCSLVGAVPLYLSGHYGSYLDASFEALSGLTTTGLTVVHDLDHLPVPMLLYRHGLELLGALAIVAVGLTLLTAATATSPRMTAGDVRDERILPSPGRTWRRVVQVAALLLGFGLVTTTVAVALSGAGGLRALVHGLSLTIAAGTTGGFSLQSASVGFYHSTVVEGAIVPLMLAGALSFGLHRAGWRGDRLKLLGDIELRGLALSMLTVGTIVLVGLGRSGAATDLFALLRRGGFATIAAHTTTGLHNVTPRFIATGWGELAPAGLVAAMTVGGMTGSTAGGLKVLRIGVIAKGVVADVKRVLLPDSALIAPTFEWSGRRRRLEHGHIRSAIGLLLLLLGGLLAGATAILFLDPGTNLTEALFLATSAATNSGQTLGTLAPSDPAGVKLGLGTLMLLGRLEWLAVFATFGFLYASLRGRT